MGNLKSSARIARYPRYNEIVVWILFFILLNHLSFCIVENILNAMEFVEMIGAIPKNFLADHPFIILLQQQNNFLFHGKVANFLQMEKEMSPIMESNKRKKDNSVISKQNEVWATFKPDSMHGIKNNTWAFEKTIEIQFVLTSAPMTNYFLADHPFIIILRQKTNILFTGRIGHPVSGDGNIAPKGEPVKDPFGHIINIKL